MVGRQSRQNSRSWSAVNWEPMAARLTMIGDEGKFAAHPPDVGEGHQGTGLLLAERTGGVAGHEFANLVEFQQIERVCVHRRPGGSGERRQDTGSGAAVRAYRHCKRGGGGVPGGVRRSKRVNERENV